MSLPDGTTTRDNLESIRRQTGEMPDELLPVDCPEQVRYIFDNFWRQLDRRRQGQNPISHQEIDAWARLRAIQLNGFEMEMLDRIESLFFRELKRVKPK